MEWIVTSNVRKTQKNVIFAWTYKFTAAVISLQNAKIGRLNKTTDFFTMTALLSEIRQNHLDEAPQEFETVEDDDDTADNVDNTQCFVIEFGAE